MRQFAFPRRSLTLMFFAIALTGGPLPSRADNEGVDDDSIRLVDPFQSPLSEEPFRLFEEPPDLVGPNDGQIRAVNYQPPPLAGASGDIQIRPSGGRRSSSRGSSSGFLSGGDAKKKASQDLGAFIGTSRTVTGTSLQKRNPISSDLRVRGNSVGQLVASGSYWVPGRFDLDTMLSKLDSRSVGEVRIIKGPYSAVNGPGLAFVDFELAPAERFPDGFESHGSTSVDFRDNGRQWYGRQSLWAGGTDWGVRVSYSHRTGNDYNTGDGNGAGQSILGSYNSRDLELVLGCDFSPTRHLDFHALRLDQTNVEFPGLAFNIDILKTDGYELKYVDEAPMNADRFEGEGWFNRTVFHGTGNGNYSGPLETDVDAGSAGYRFIASWGHAADAGELLVGTDLIYLTTELNDLEPSSVFPQDADNFPVPNSLSADFGVFAEFQRDLSSWHHVKLGARADFIRTDADDITPAGRGDSMSTILGSELQQNFALWSVFGTSTYELDDFHQLILSAGHGQRPPALTELYSAGSFVGLVQAGLSSLTGDPQLAPERATQIDVGVRFDYPDIRGGVNWHYAWVQDYIAWGGDAPTPTLFGALSPVNTNAVLTGIEADVEADLTSSFSAFATITYLAGDDLTRDVPARLSMYPTRGNAGPIPEEPLSGIAPLETRIGITLHDPSDAPLWSVDFLARIVDNQSRVAGSLNEIRTPGFTTVHIHGHAQLTSSWSMILGVDNVGDRFYREHLDYRTLPHPLLQPGRTYYVGSELVY